MSHLQLRGMGECTSQQLTTTVTSLASFVPSIQTKVSARNVNVLNVLRNELYKALRAFLKIEH